MYRLILESLLGVKLEAGKLRVAPCIPGDWQQYKVHYRFGEAVYHIAVSQTHGGNSGLSVTVDGVEQSDLAVTLIDDHREHEVDIRV
jgi:cellobiose phosphorylase